MNADKRAPVALRVAVVAGILALLIGGGVFIYNFFQGVTVSQADRVKPDANGVATFPEKLPGGFAWNVGVRVNELVDVVSAKAQDGQELRLTRVKSVSKKTDQMLDEMTGLRKHAGGGNYIYQVANSGTDKIADVPLIWKLVNLDRRGERSQAFYGIVTAKANEIVMVTGIQKGEKYNLDETMEFLRGIKSWQSTPSQEAHQ